MASNQYIALVISGATENTYLRSSQRTPEKKVLELQGPHKRRKKASFKKRSDIKAVVHKVTVVTL